jgi:hypothetical protein
MLARDVAITTDKPKCGADVGSCNECDVGNTGSAYVRKIMSSLRHARNAIDAGKASTAPPRGIIAPPSESLQDLNDPVERLAVAVFLLRCIRRLGTVLPGS